MDMEQPGMAGTARVYRFRRICSHPYGRWNHGTCRCLDSAEKEVLGCGTQKGNAEYYRGVPVNFTLLPKIKVEVIVSAVPVRMMIDVIL